MRNKISDNIEKLQNDSLDLDLQARLANVKRNMEGLDSSNEKYTNLVKEVLELQIQRLENQRNELKKEISVKDKVKVNSKIANIEKELKSQLELFTKQKLDKKTNSNLKDLSTVTIKDLEKIFNQFSNEIRHELDRIVDSSINITSDKQILRPAINSKRESQELIHVESTGDEEKPTRDKIAGEELDSFFENAEKELTESLKESFADIKETIETTNSKREYDIQSKKYDLLLEVVKTKGDVISEENAKELQELISAAFQEIKNKSGKLNTLSGKYEDIKADAERLGIFEKLNAAGDSLATGLGKIDSELGDFAEKILYFVGLMDRVATQIFKIPETFSKFRKFLSGTANILMGGDSQSPDQTNKFTSLEKSIEGLGKKFDEVAKNQSEENQSAPSNETQGDAKPVSKFGESLKGLTRVTKDQRKNLGVTNKLTKLSNFLMQGMNFQMAGFIKIMSLSKLKSFFGGMGSLFSKYSTYILTGVLAVSTFSKGLLAKSFIRTLGVFKSGIFAIGTFLATFAKYTIPLLMTGITGLVGAFTALSLPVQGLVAGVGLAVAALFLLPKAVDAIIQYVKSFIPSAAGIKKGFNSTVDTVGGWINSINPFGESESEKQARQIEQGVISQQSKGGGIIPGLKSSNSSDASKEIKSKIQSNAQGQLGEMTAKSESGKAGSSISQNNTGITKGSKSSSLPGTLEERKSKIQPMTGYGQLGEMTAKSESGKAGSSAIGWDGTGGWSYGKYQVKQSNVPSFMKYLDEDTRAQLENSGPVGSKEFNTKWKEMAKAGSLGAAEQKYIEDTHYKPTLARAKDGEELSKRGKGLQELLFSISVNEGEALGASTINNALKEKDVANMKDEEIIESISTYRKDNLKNRYKSSTPQIQASIARRIEEERIGALGYDNKKIEMAMDKQKQLEVAENNQMAMNQAKTFAQAMPSQSILNQSNNMTQSSTKPNTPVDLRNLESTFIRMMNADFGLFR